MYTMYIFLWFLLPYLTTVGYLFKATSLYFNQLTHVWLGSMLFLFRRRENVTSLPEHSDSTSFAMLGKSLPFSQLIFLMCKMYSPQKVLWWENQCK